MKAHVFTFCILFIINKVKMLSIQGFASLSQFKR